MSFTVEEFLKDLEQIVNIDSGSKCPEGTKAVADFFAAKFGQIGWATEYIDMGGEVGPCLKAINRVADKYDLLIIGHMDTVFPAGTVKERPFKIEDNRAYGPGVIDMKPGLLYAWHVAEEINRNDELKEKNICILFNSDEEISSIYSRPLIEKIAPSCGAVIVLEPARSNGGTVQSRKGISKYFIDFRGIAAHAGVDPENGASAIDELCYVVTELNKLRNPDKGTTVNAGVIKGGTVPNVVAESAQVQIDVRMTEVAEAEAFDKRVRELATAPQNSRVKITVDGGLKRPPMNNPTVNGALFKLVEEAGAEVGIEIKWVATGGGSDANFTSALGVPTLDTLGPIGGLGHGVGEYMEIDSVLPRLDLLMRVVRKILAAK